MFSQKTGPIKKLKKCEVVQWSKYKFGPLLSENICKNINIQKINEKKGKKRFGMEALQNQIQQITQVKEYKKNKVAGRRMSEM